MAGDKYALVIGARGYDKVPKLKWADKDARDVAAALRRTGFDEQNVIVLHDEDPEARPERSMVFHQLGRLGNIGLDSDDLVLFYFSGHGMMHKSVDYLLPIEASDVALKHTAIKVDDVVASLQETGSRQVVMLIDACRDELPTGKSVHAIGANAAKSVTDATHEGIAAIFSCESQERSFEIDAEDIKQSSFTYCLLDAIVRPNVNTLEQVATYLRDEVKVLNGKHGLQPQKPYLVAQPEWLKEISIFGGLEGVSELDRYISCLTDLYGNEELSDSVYYDVLDFLDEPKHLPGLLKLIRDVCDGASSPDRFEKTWNHLRSRAAPRKATAGAVGTPGTSLRSGG